MAAELSFAEKPALRWDGQWIDSHVMAILASEWRAGRRTRAG